MYIDINMDMEMDTGKYPGSGTRPDVSVQRADVRDWDSSGSIDVTASPVHSASPPLLLTLLMRSLSPRPLLVSLTHVPYPRPIPTAGEGDTEVEVGADLLEAIGDATLFEEDEDLDDLPEDIE